MLLSDVIQKVAKDIGMKPSRVHDIYYAYWKFIKTTIEDLPLKNDLKFDEFKKLRVNFNIPRLGKLYVTVDDYQRQNYFYKKEIENDKNKKGNSDVQRSDYNNG